MRSTVEQVGFEATVTRSNGTTFEEYDIKQTLKDDGERLTECYISTEADVVIEIKVNTLPTLKHFKTSQWMAETYVDGKRLSGDVWENPRVPHIFKWIYSEAHGNGSKRGRLTITAAETTQEAHQATASEDEVAQLGEIVIRLKPGKWSSEVLCEPLHAEVTGSVHEEAKKLPMTISSNHWEDFVPGQYSAYTLSPSRDPVWRKFKGENWQTFTFKYRHPVALEKMGIIAAPEIPVAGPSRVQTAAEMRSDRARRRTESRAESDDSRRSERLSNDFVKIEVQTED